MARDLGAARPEDVGLSSEGLARIDGFLQGMIDNGDLAGAVTLVARHGQVVHTNTLGKKDVATGEPLKLDTIFRIFSMTKPVTGTAMMILHDQGRWKAEDPIAKHLPEFKDVKVFGGLNAAGEPILEAPDHAPTVGELMTHTAGFSYGFDPNMSVDKLYQKVGVWRSADLEELSRKVAGLPLLYQPGSKWLYSLSMDLQGAMIERLSGQTLPEFMRTRMFEPLGMVDTAFHTPPAKKHRLATLYRWSKKSGLKATANPLLADQESPPALASGGGGLVSTAGDYARYAQMLLNGGEFAGVRIVSPEALKLQMGNQLPDHIIHGGFGVGRQQIRPGFSYGFDGAVFTDPAKAGVPVGEGTYQWDGAAGTWFWVDPVNDLLFVGMIQWLSESPIMIQATTQTLMADAILK